jgi:hypothetical protein
MPVVGVCGAGLTSLRREAVLEDAAHLCDPVTLMPGLHQPPHLDRACHGNQINRRLARLVNHHEPALPRGSTPSPPPSIAAARCLQTLLPGPLGGLEQVRAFALAPVCKREGLRALSWHQPGARRRWRDVAPSLRVAAPALGHDQRGGARYPPCRTRRPALLEHGLGQRALVVAASPGTLGLGPSEGTGAWDAELTIAHDAEAEHPSDTGPGTCARAPGPGADEPAWFAVVPEASRSNDPSPWPATGGGGACALGMAPNGPKHRQAQAPQAFEPGACGESAETRRRALLVPSTPPREVMAMSASQEGGKQERNDWAQEFLWGRQAACELGHQGSGQSQGLQGLMEGFERVLGLGALVLEALLGCEATACAGFGWFVGVSFQGGQGDLLRTALVLRFGWKETLPPSG